MLLKSVRVSRNKAGYVQWLVAGAATDQNISDDHRVVVQHVTRCVHKRDLTSPGHAAEFPKLLITYSKFCRVAPLELLPAIRIVRKPLPQFGTGSDLLAPLIDCSRLLTKPAGPEPVHQNASTVLRGRLLVCSL